MSEHNHYQENKSEIKQRNILTPAGTSAAITGPSTQQNGESKVQIMPEGLTCFGNPTLETLKIKEQLPQFDFQIRQVVRKRCGVSESGQKIRANRQRKDTLAQRQFKAKRGLSPEEQMYKTPSNKNANRTQINYSSQEHLANSQNQGKQKTQINIRLKEGLAKHERMVVSDPSKAHVEQVEASSAA